MTAVASYRWTRAVRAPETGGHGHVDVLQISALMFPVWVDYMREGTGLEEHAVFRESARPIVKEVTTTVDAEIFPGELLQCGVRTGRIGRSSISLDVALWRGDAATTCARGRVVFVTIDMSERKSVEVPEEVRRVLEESGMNTGE